MPAVLTNANTYEYGKGPKDPECPVCGVAVKIEVACIGS